MRRDDCHAYGMGQVDFSSHVFVDTTGVLVRNAAGANSFRNSLASASPWSAYD
jgi:hypothetical protein